MRTKNSSNETELKNSEPRPVLGMEKNFSSGHIIEFHGHIRSQLLYASNGIMTVTTDQGIWVVPPLRAVWIPPHVQHQIKTLGNLSMRTLYIDPGYCHNTPEHCCVVSVSPFLKELILTAVKIPADYELNSPEDRIMAVILDQIRQMEVTPLNLPIPKDPRLKEIFVQLSENPGDKRTLTEWGNLVCTTRRTLTRLFQSDIGMGFGQWRQQIRILESLGRIAMNEPVTSVAIDLGYDSPSAFISMFKKALGKTPGKYFSV